MLTARAQVSREEPAVCASPGRVISPEVVSKNVADSVNPAEIRRLCSKKILQ